MRNEELSAAQAQFTYDRQRISELRKACTKAGIIGQPRAMKALETGMNVNTKGYNIYISGEDGTGRHSAVREIAAAMTSARHVLDVMYCCNFKQPQRPFLITLQSPLGSELKAAMDKVADLVTEENFPKALA